MMKKNTFAKYLFPMLASFMLASQALADPNAFELLAESKKVGQGSLEKLHFAQAKVTIEFNHRQYSGVGNLNRSLPNFAYGMQNNRGALPLREKKNVSVVLTAADNSQMTCELTSVYGRVYGECIDSANNSLRITNNVVENS
jgi:hypothetical protein